MPVTGTEPIEMPISDDAHPSVRTLYEYWRSISPKGRLPGRQHFDPVDIPALLPNIWLLDVHRDPIRFWRRLVGSRVVEFAGISCAPGWLAERLNDEKRSKVDRDLIGVVNSKCPNWRRGRSLIMYQKEFAELERLYLPLATDGEIVDMILAISIFYDILVPEMENTDRRAV
jgi:hypothetical protein